MSFTIYLTRLVCAFLFGSLIGAERQYRLKNAGLRTNTLVSLGSAVFILLSISLTGIAGDPSRIASQIVTGVGFLGGGLILKDGVSVKGLNTTATIWCSAAVGAMAGLGLYWQGLFAVFFIISANCLLRPLGELLNSHQGFDSYNEQLTYTFAIRCKEQIENHLRVMILNAVKNDPHLQLHSLKSSDDNIPAYCYIVADIYALGKHDLIIEKLAGQLTIEYGVTDVSWEVCRNGNE
ncbi:MAG: MgtC/SapB family protein [Tannerellaceae bacterium]|nr:MgtC/SapB family protein [Tannerellaceae bacterium]